MLHPNRYCTSFNNIFGGRADLFVARSRLNFRGDPNRATISKRIARSLRIHPMRNDRRRRRPASNRASPGRRLRPSQDARLVHYWKLMGDAPKKKIIKKKREEEEKTLNRSVLSTAPTRGCHSAASSMFHPNDAIKRRRIRETKWEIERERERDALRSSNRRSWPPMTLWRISCTARLYRVFFKRSFLHVLDFFGNLTELYQVYSSICLIFLMWPFESRDKGLSRDLLVSYPVMASFSPILPTFID